MCGCARIAIAIHFPTCCSLFADPQLPDPLVSLIFFETMLFNADGEVFLLGGVWGGGRGEVCSKLWHRSQ